MRALWHYIAYGETLPSHMYRGLHDKSKVLDVEQFVTDKVAESQLSDMEENDYFEDQDDRNQDDESFEDVDNEESEDFSEVDITMFKMIWEDFGDKIVKEMELSKNNSDLKKAVRSVTKKMEQTMTSKTSTLINQLIWFGKEQNAKRERGRVMGKINVKPLTVARSKANGNNRRGKKATLKGRPYKAVQEDKEIDGEVFPSQPKPHKKKKKEKHSFKVSLEKNKLPSQRHKKQ